MICSIMGSMLKFYLIDFIVVLRFILRRQPLNYELPPPNPSSTPPF